MTYPLKPKSKHQPVALFPDSICKNVTHRGTCLLFRLKRLQTIETKKAQQKLFWVEWGQWQRSWLPHRGSLGADTAPRAAGSHFLPGAGESKRPIVTPEELREEVTIGRYTVLETVMRLCLRNSLLMAVFLLLYVFLFMFQWNTN